MKKMILIGLIAFSTLFVFSQKKENAISVIPEPVNMVRGTGYYKLPEVITVSIPNLPELKTTSESVLAKLSATGKKVSILNSKNAVIRFELTKIHEEILRGPASMVLDELEEPRGEFTVAADIGQITEYSPIAAPSDEQMLAEFGGTTNNETVNRRRAIALLATKHRMTPNDVYAAIERAKKSVK